MGVPVIAPVEMLRLSPDGRDGETEYVRGAAPPAPVIGVNEVAAIPEVSPLLEIETVTVKG